MINETHHYLVCQLVGGSLFSLFSGLRIIIVIRIHQTYVCIEGEQLPPSLRVGVGCVGGAGGEEQFSQIRTY